MARFKQCVICDQVWNISVRQEIPPDGYECPWCASKRKSAYQLRIGQAQGKNIISAF